MLTSHFTVHLLTLIRIVEFCFEDEGSRLLRNVSIRQTTQHSLDNVVRIQTRQRAG
jgi:hypothetical protein